MIKINRNIELQRINEAKRVLNEEKAKKRGSYGRDEVIDALSEIFSGKCYICENKNITSYNVEHFRPHKDNKELKFDFHNLLLACGHCNNIKLGNYDHLLDCSQIDVDELISFRKFGNFAWEERIEIEKVNDIEETEDINETIDLLNKVYNGTTQMKKLESSNIRKELRNELLSFMEMLNEYWTSEGEDREDAKFSIKRHLKASSSFTAFKRWIIRDYKEQFSDFLQDDGMKIII